jgi:hypothetical protein
MPFQVIKNISGTKFYHQNSRKYGHGLPGKLPAGKDFILKLYISGVSAEWRNRVEINRINVGTMRRQKPKELPLSECMTDRETLLQLGYEKEEIIELPDGRCVLNYRLLIDRWFGKKNIYSLFYSCDFL